MKYVAQIGLAKPKLGFREVFGYLLMSSGEGALQSTLYKCYTYKCLPSLNVDFLLLPTYCTL